MWPKNRKFNAYFLCAIIFINMATTTKAGPPAIFHGNDIWRYAPHIKTNVVNGLMAVGHFVAMAVHFKAACWSTENPPPIVQVEPKTPPLPPPISPPNKIESDVEQLERLLNSSSENLTKIKENFILSSSLVQELQTEYENKILEKDQTISNEATQIADHETELLNQQQQLDDQVDINSKNEKLITQQNIMIVDLEKSVSLLLEANLNKSHEFNELFKKCGQSFMLMTFVSNFTSKFENSLTTSVDALKENLSFELFFQILLLLIIFSAILLSAFLGRGFFQKKRQNHVNHDQISSSFNRQLKTLFNNYNLSEHNYAQLYSSMQTIVRSTMECENPKRPAVLIFFNCSNNRLDAKKFVQSLGQTINSHFCPSKEPPKIVDFYAATNGQTPGTSGWYLDLKEYFKKGGGGKTILFYNSDKIRRRDDLIHFHHLCDNDHALEKRSSLIFLFEGINPTDLNNTGGGRMVAQVAKNYLDRVWSFYAEDDRNSLIARISANAIVF